MFQQSTFAAIDNGIDITVQLPLTREPFLASLRPVTALCDAIISKYNVRVYMLHLLRVRLRYNYYKVETYMANGRMCSDPLLQITLWDYPLTVEWQALVHT